MEDDIESILKFDDQCIKSLELPRLRRISQIYDEKQKKVLVHLENLQSERDRLKQTLDGIQMKKLKLEKFLTKRTQDYEELGIRENKAQQELAKTNVMCPIYQFQMSHFLEQSSYFEAQKTGCIMSPSWSIIEEGLLEQKQKLEDRVEDRQKMIDTFVNKYFE